MKQVLVPIGYGTGFSSNCLPQFGYFNNAVASPCAYRSIPSVKELRMSALDQLRPSDVHFTPESGHPTLGAELFVQ